MASHQDYLMNFKKTPGAWTLPHICHLKMSVLARTQGILMCSHSREPLPRPMTHSVASTPLRLCHRLPTSSNQGPLCLLYSLCVSPQKSCVKILLPTSCGGSRQSLWEEEETLLDEISVLIKEAPQRSLDPSAL